MAEDHGPAVKDDGLYEKLREEGESKEKAARIANARAGGEEPGRKGGEGESYEDRTVDELREAPPMSASKVARRWTRTS